MLHGLFFFSRKQGLGYSRGANYSWTSRKVDDWVSTYHSWEQPRCLHDGLQLKGSGIRRRHMRPPTRSSRDARARCANGQSVWCKCANDQRQVVRLWQIQLLAERPWFYYTKISSENTSSWHMTHDTTCHRCCIFAVSKLGLCRTCNVHILNLSQNYY